MLNHTLKYFGRIRSGRCQTSHWHRRWFPILEL